MTATTFCQIHLDENNEERRAVARDAEFGPVCEDCARDLGQMRGSERRYQSQYASACGYRD